jgi:hypothetical protein
MSDFSTMPLADKHRKKAIRKSFKDFLKRLDNCVDEIDSCYALGRVACALEVLSQSTLPKGGVDCWVRSVPKLIEWVHIHLFFGFLAYFYRSFYVFVHRLLKRFNLII